MMKKFSPADTNMMSWEEFGELANEVASQIRQYFEKKGESIDAVAPILRNGAVLGTIISNKLHIITQLPIQVKYNYEKNTLEQLLPFYKPTNVDFGEAPTILLSECNTFSGESAKLAASIVLQAYPQAKLYYATLTKVYRDPEVTLPMFQHCFYGRMTNENFEASEEQESRLNLRPRITIFPWETVADELDDINNATSSEVKP